MKWGRGKPLLIPPSRLDSVPLSLRSPPVCALVPIGSRLIIEERTLFKAAVNQSMNATERR